MGQMDSTETETDFSTTALALHAANTVNAVSKLHRKVTRGLFEQALRGAHHCERPVKAITNGVHAPTWLAPEWQDLLDRKCGEEWRDAKPGSDYWTRITSLSDDDVSKVRNELKHKLIDVLKRRLRMDKRSTAHSSEY